MDSVCKLSGSIFASSSHNDCISSRLNFILDLYHVINGLVLKPNLYKDYIIGEYDKKYKFKLYDNRIGNEINTNHLI